MKIFAIIAMALMIAIPVMAEDVILNTTIDSVTAAIDKNGDEYVRVIIVEDRVLQGVSYTATVPLMFFGEMAAQAKDLKKGQAIRVLANKKEYKGNHSYMARQLLPLEE